MDFSDKTSFQVSDPKEIKIEFTALMESDSNNFRELAKKILEMKLGQYQNGYYNKPGTINLKYALESEPFNIPAENIRFFNIDVLSPYDARTPLQFIYDKYPEEIVNEMIGTVISKYPELSKEQAARYIIQLGY